MFHPPDTIYSKAIAQLGQRFEALQIREVSEGGDKLLYSDVVEPSSTEIRLNMAREHFSQKLFRRKDYLEIMGGISPQTATKDLACAVRQGLLEKMGDNINTKYKFKQCL